MKKLITVNSTFDETMKEAQENGVAMFNRIRIVKGKFVKDLKKFGFMIIQNVPKDSWVTFDIMKEFDNDLEIYNSLEEAVADSEEKLEEDYFYTHFENKDIEQQLKKNCQKTPLKTIKEKILFKAYCEEDRLHGEYFGRYRGFEKFVKERIKYNNSILKVIQVIENKELAIDTYIKEQSQIFCKI